MLQLQPLMYKQQYLMLIEQCFFECDVVSFCLPAFEGCDFLEYKNKIRPILNAFEPNLIYTEQTKLYVNQETDYLNEVYYYKTIGLSGEPFNQVESIYDWKHPNFPEDMCFYKNRECWLQSIAHEKICFIYDDSRQMKACLKWLGFHFLKSRAEQPPRLSAAVPHPTLEA